MDSAFIPWECPTCTLINEKSLICEVCQTPFPDISNQLTPKINPTSDEFWSCNVCTLSNPISLSKCSVCNNPNLTQKSNFSTDESDDEWQKLRKRYGFDSKFNTSNSYSEQYEQNLAKEWSQNKISWEELNKRKQELSNLREPEQYQTVNLISFLQTSFNNPKGPHEYYLCSPLNFYCSNEGDRGWGCGYRNIQMLFSCLMNYPKFRNCIFKGSGIMPNIPSLQEWLQNAWQEGFDADGASQLGYNIFNSKRLIGTTECVTLLRSFRIKAKILEFYSIKKPDYDNLKLILEERELLDQFLPEIEKKKSRKKRPKITLFQPNIALIDFVKNYFKERKNLDLTPPLYIQQPGHSRTIVGFERRGNETFLLLFDPSHFGKTLREDILGNNLKKIRKASSTFTHEKYQLVLIESFDLIEENEIDKWKKI